MLDHLWHDAPQVESIYCWYHPLEYLSTADANSKVDVFLYDRIANTTDLISSKANGDSSDGDSSVSTAAAIAAAASASAAVAASPLG